MDIMDPNPMFPETSQQNNNNFAGGDVNYVQHKIRNPINNCCTPKNAHSDGMDRLKTIQNSLFTRPPDNFVKTGKSGRPTQLMANFVSIDQRPDLVVHQYHVEFDPPIDSKTFRHSILKQQHIQDDIGNAFIFDGMILYIASNTDVEGNYTAYHPTTNEKINIRLRASVRFNQNDAQAINCYNIIIRSCMDMVGLKRLGRNHYDELQKVKLRDYDMEVWPGFETAVRQYEDRLMLCIENRFKMIRTQSVWELMNNVYRHVEYNLERFHAKIEELLVGETVFARYNNKMYRVTSINYEMSPGATFTLCDGSVTTLKEYFEKNYNLSVTQMKQPVLVRSIIQSFFLNYMLIFQISEGKVKQPGEAPHCAYLLPELCFPTGLTESMRKDFRHMRELSQHTRLDPEKRRITTENLLERIHKNERCLVLLQKWGIELEEKLISFQSRELEPEKLIGIRPHGYFGQRAEWSRGVRQHGNYRGVYLQNWIVIAPNTIMALNLASHFIEEVKNMGEAMHIQVNYPMLHSCNDISATSYHKAVLEAMQRAAAQPIHMIVIILADDSKARYDLLKSWLCTETNIPSQCVQLSTLRGRQHEGRNKNFMSIVLKILLQMNCKMGGALWKVNIPVKNAMIVGYDLYHDSTLRGQTVGACVSTTDTDYTQFYSQTRPHDNPTELGTNLGVFIKKALQKYFVNNNGSLPEKIFLYRDGVGDGQIPFVKEQEVVTQVKQACIEISKTVGLDPVLNPIKLAFIIVTKKVNMRIFKGSPDTTLTNPSPGTVVDSVITRPERYDFYLVPQHVSQGTVTPVCYNVIYDDTGLEPDQHHKLAFKLCHLYYNWQGTVRVPAPCQYAHKLAFMVAQSIHRNVNEELHDKLFFL
ncbi:piwi domain protein [Dictyocaulus viviparus]|uniref:Piwi domain protein n=1 Tax=Dictyocaulus viviparus TaxID=29172 RepID=A0A0D8XI63_DICVI|nr:piwi domain protein [Dictyocaulus viviparus]